MVILTASDLQLLIDITQRSFSFIIILEIVFWFYDMILRLVSYELRIEVNIVFLKALNSLTVLAHDIGQLFLCLYH